MEKITCVNYLQKNYKELMTTQERRGKKNFYWNYKFSMCLLSQSTMYYMQEIGDNNARHNMTEEICIISCFIVFVYLSNLIHFRCVKFRFQITSEPQFVRWMNIGFKDIVRLWDLGL